MSPYDQPEEPDPFRDDGPQCGFCGEPLAICDCPPPPEDPADELDVTAALDVLLERFRQLDALREKAQRDQTKPEEPPF